jgi:hypothetical protein
LFAVFLPRGASEPAGLNESARFARALAKLADIDAEVHRVSFRVQQPLDPPEILVRSGISARVLARLPREMQQDGASNSVRFGFIGGQAQKVQAPLRIRPA